MRLVFTLLAIVTMTVVAMNASAEIRVTDYNGDEVILPKPAIRIVGLSPHIVENVFAAGAGDLLVGVVEYSDYPQQAMALPKVGSFASINREALLILSPDLVIAWKTGNGDQIIQQVRDLGIPVYVDEPSTLQDIARSLQDIGELTQRQNQANETTKNFLKTLESIRENHANAATISVLYQIWHSPIQTVNDDHIISDVIKLCGGNNIFGDAISAAPIINRETVIDRDPDVIIASGANNQRPAWLDLWQQWPSLTAVRKQHLFFIEPDILQRHTVRILEGARQMCSQLSLAR